MRQPWQQILIHNESTVLQIRTTIVDEWMNGDLQFHRSLAAMVAQDLPPLDRK
jgi:hypothetical protein